MVFLRPIGTLLDNLLKSGDCMKSLFNLLNLCVLMLSVSLFGGYRTPADSTVETRDSVPHARFQCAPFGYDNNHSWAENQSSVPFK